MNDKLRKQELAVKKVSFFFGYIFMNVTVVCSIVILVAGIFRLHDSGAMDKLDMQQRIKNLRFQF
jgi:hypothetical protein